MQKRLSITTPCFNEEGNLEPLYSRVCAVMDSMPEYQFEWVIIDNCSIDRSREILRHLAAKDKRIKVIFNTRNFGPGRSSCYGLYQTTGDASICVACDLQDPPELIPQFIRKWENGADVVLGRITESEESAGSFATRGLFYKILNLFSDNKVESHVTGFGLYSRRVIRLLMIEANPNPNYRFSISNFGFAVEYVDYIQPLRSAGKSSYNFISKLNTSIDALVQASTSPVRIITLSGAVLAGIAIPCCLILSVFDLILLSEITFRFALSLLVLGVAGLLALAIGVVGEYVVSTLAHVKSEPLVIEKERINLEFGNLDNPWVAPARSNQEEERLSQ